MNKNVLLAVGAGAVALLLAGKLGGASENGGTTIFEGGYFLTPSTNAGSTTDYTSGVPIISAPASTIELNSASALNYGTSSPILPSNKKEAVTSRNLASSSGAVALIPTARGEVYINSSAEVVGGIDTIAGQSLTSAGAITQLKKSANATPFERFGR